ncbi:hypothetical protein MRX96_021000 [Rhipicephalus microplus]
MQFVVSSTTSTYEKSSKNVRGSTASSYKVATMSTFYGAQPRRTVSSTGTYKAPDSTARQADGRRTSATDGKYTAGAASTDLKKRPSITQKAGEHIALSYRKASLPTESHVQHTINRLVMSEPIKSATQLITRRPSAKSFTDLSGRKPADFAMASPPSTFRRRASTVSLGNCFDGGKPKVEQSAASDKSQSKLSQHSRLLSKRSCSKIHLPSSSDKEKPM